MTQVKLTDHAAAFTVNLIFLGFLSTTSELQQMVAS